LGRHLFRRRNGNDLIYAGKVDHGFDKQSSALRERLTPLIRKTSPIPSPKW
jgi:bifunctional non-homologous end joining protein LigD